MRGILIPLLIGLMSCASSPPERKVASLEPLSINPTVEISRSKVQIFPALADGEGIWYYFYIQLKNAEGQFVDSDDLILKTTAGAMVPFKLERVLPGRYYLTLRKSPGLSSAQMNLFVQGKPLKEEFKLHFAYPDRKNSRMELMSSQNHKNVFRLHLLDANNQYVAIKDTPEIHLEGPGLLESPVLVSEGIWEFTVLYPDENNIIYISVRSMGIFMPRLFRYQHVEK